MMVHPLTHSAPLGRLLLDTGVLTQVQLDEMLVLQRTDRRRLGELLVEQGFVNPIELAQILSHQLGCPWVSLTKLEVGPEVVRLLPEEIANEHNLIPVHLRVVSDRSVLYVATDDPTDDVALAECSAAVGMPVRPIVAISSEVRAARARIYGTQEGEGPKTEATPDHNQPASPFAPTERPISSQTRKNPTPPPLGIAPKTAPIPKDDFLHRPPTVLALNAPAGFLTQCRAAVLGLGAAFVDGGILRAGELVTEYRPCAIVVTDDVYAFDRSALNRLALDNDAHLIVLSEDVDGRQLEPLLAGAIVRWGRSTYEKGAVIDGRYELLRDLGSDPSDASTSRWDVRHVRTERHSLLVLANRSEGEASLALVRRQQAALSRVSHPGAIELRDAGTTELGDPYIVLEPLEGRTLDGLLAAKSKLDAQDVCGVISSIADVLAEAHSVGVVHRHVVLDNIVIVRDGYGVERVKLIGWGRASVTDAAEVDAREDLVALANCAVEALTGRGGSSSSNGLAEVPDPLMPLLRASKGRSAAASEIAAAFRDAARLSRKPTHLLEASPRSRNLATGKKESVARPEQRRWTRVPYRTPVRVEVVGVGTIEGRCEDISRGGMLVVCRGRVAAGARVTVRFALPLDGRPVAETGIVRWSHAARSDANSITHAVGIELDAMSSEAVRQVERYSNPTRSGSWTAFG